MISDELIICPLSPSIPNSNPSSEDEAGWANLESAPIRAEAPQSLSASRTADDDDVMDADEGTVVQKPRGLPAPPEPTVAEVAQHNLTHFPYRSWCPHCLACRRPNAHHRRSSSSSTRKVPLFCADYCFVKDSQDTEMATVLAGRLYPSMAVVATVCDAKGTEDEKAIRRLTQFIKESQYPQIVYKSDQERAIAKMIEYAIKGAGRSGIPESEEAFASGVSQAVAEFSAVGESASNGRGERTVQAVEDLLRTLKSALEARIKVRIPADHAIMRWLVEHVATILNRYSVNKEGVTPFFAFHGKRSAEKLVEFGERVSYFVPRKARAKLDHRWRLGTFVGLSTSSNESMIATSNGSEIVFSLNYVSN